MSPHRGGLYGGPVPGTMAGALDRGLGVERWKALTLTPGMVLGLFFLQRYRFLTIAQVAQAAGLSFDYTAEVMRGLDLDRPIHGGPVWPAAALPPRAGAWVVSDGVRDRRHLRSSRGPRGQGRGL